MLEEDGAGPLGIVDDEADHAVVGGLRDVDGPQVDLGVRQDAGDVGQLSGPVLQEY